jgi:glutamyl-tRNA reductase
MAIVTLGINHTTAPVSVRERIAFPTEKLQNALRDLIRRTPAEEAAILSTCNRTELYWGAPLPSPRAIIDWLSNHHHLRREEIAPYLYTYTDSGTIRHIFRVACGLDSLILGEPQILGQMKTAYQTASESGTLGKHLGKLFQHTFATAKKVRSDTAIGSSPVSVAFAAVRLAQRIFDDLSEQTALLIGAGETIELTARHLHEQGVGAILIANRSYDKAHALAVQFNGLAISLPEIPRHLPHADIVVTSTASPLPILGKGSVESAIKARKHKPIFMVDLAVPRDIEPEVEDLPDVYLYTVDDLQSVVEENLRSRQEAAGQAEEIIDQEVEHFLGWLRAQGATATIRDFRRQAEEQRDAALEHTLRELRSGAVPEDALRHLAHLLTNKLLHIPSTQIRQAGENERHDLIAAARELFKLRKTSDS